MLNGLKVLVVEDHSDTCELYREILGQQGAAVETVGDEPSATEAIEKDRPDLVVTDLWLTLSSSGAEHRYSLLHTMRAIDQRDGSSTPVILVSGLPLTEDDVRDVDAQFDGYLRKPFDSAELVATIARVTGRAAPPKAAES